jgi:hypothetical protein
MIEISKRGTPTVYIRDELLSHICLQVTGGGWTTQQTAKAMLLQADVERDGVGKFKGVTVKKVAP